MAGLMDNDDLIKMMQFQMFGDSLTSIGNALQQFDAQRRGVPFHPTVQGRGVGSSLQAMIALKEQAAREAERKQKLAAQAQLFGMAGSPWTNPDTGQIGAGTGLMDKLPLSPEQKQIYTVMGLMDPEKTVGLMGKAVDPSASKGTAPIQNFEYRSRLVKEHGENSPEVNRYDNYVRQNPWVNLGDQMVLPNPAQPGQPMAAMPKGVPPQDQPALRGEQKMATERADVAVKREADMPKAQAAMADLEAKTGVVTQDIDRALANTGFWTSGFAGSLSAAVPGTEAHNMRRLIETIKANVGFDQLSAMRAASPTGGALGSVTERENTLLQSVLGSLEQSQSPEQLKSNLQRLKTILSARQARLAAAFEQDYGKAKAQKSAPSTGWSIQRID